jgi:hypothetical protein
MIWITVGDRLPRIDNTRLSKMADYYKPKGRRHDVTAERQNGRMNRGGCC